MNKETYNALYQNIIDQTSDLMTSLSQENSHIHQEEARIVAQQTLDRLQNLQEKMQSNLTELQKNAEWDLFTIAFYGETNAGKSTLIETLRLLLKEKTKLEEHKKYDENEKLEATQTQKLEQTASRYKQLEKEKQDYIALFNKQYQKTAVSLHQQEQDLASNIHELQAYLTGKNIWNIPLSTIFQYHRKKKELPLLTAHLQALQAKNKGQLQEMQQQNMQKSASFQSKLQTLAREQQYWEQQKSKTEKKLQTLGDGNIIGDGRSDFTRKTQSYTFWIDNHPFRLLDLPGIEGAEDLVKDEIRSSLQRCHAVFYISSKNTPPQHGEDGQEGAIEKIASQLNAQAEIYSVYNKRITSPAFLTDELETPDDKTALTELQQRLKETLSDRYKKHFSVSAQPAFLSVAEKAYIPPGNNLLKQQEKFLKRFSTDELREKSQLNAFVRALVDITQATKIEKANRYQIFALLTEAKKIAAFIQNQLTRISQKVNSEINIAKRKLKENQNSYCNTLKAASAELVQMMISTCRAELYKKIDEGISNKELAENAKSLCTRKITQLNSDLQRQKEKATAELEKRHKAVLSRLNERVSEFTEVLLSKSRISTYDNFKIPSKLTWEKIGKGTSQVLLFSGLLKKLLEIIKTASKGGGKILTVATGLAAVAVVLGGLFFIGKTIWNIVHKKDHQKKHISQDLSNMEKHIQQELRQWQEENALDIEKVTKQLDEHLDGINQSYTNQQKYIKDFINTLDTMQNNILQKELL